MPLPPPADPIDAPALARLECRRQAVGVAEIADLAEPILGGLMCYTAPGSWTNQAMGVGLDGPADAGEVDRLIDFYVSRGQEPRVEVCPYAHDTLINLLLKRGFGIAEFENVLVITGSPVHPPVPEGLSVRRIDPDCSEDLDAWVRVSSSGVALHPRTSAFVAETQGRIVGAGAMEIARPFGSEAVACLFAASVLPEHRRGGVQQALIAARIDHARRHGCVATFIHAKPGIPTERNARRLGFQNLYTAVALVMRREGLARSV
jgi:GNAT superfamily N-acetyltransferase